MRAHKKVVVETVASVTNLPGVGKGSTAVGERAMCTRLAIPANAPAASAGALVCCAYFVNWTLHSGAFSFTNNVRNSIGFPLFDTNAVLPAWPPMPPAMAPPAGSPAAPTAPPAGAPVAGWAPQQVAAATFALPSAPPLPPEMVLACEYDGDDVPDAWGPRPVSRGGGARAEAQPLLG